MKLNMSFNDYKPHLEKISNEPVYFQELLKPFHLNLKTFLNHDNIIPGLLLDFLSEKFTGDDLIDCIDIAVAASDLGCEDADLFLDQCERIFANKNLHG